MFTSLLDDNKINYNIILFVIIGIIIYFIYTFNIKVTFHKKEQFKSLPKPIHYNTKQAKKELELLNKMKHKYVKRCKPQINLTKEVVSDVFDVSKAPKKLVTWPLEKRKTQSLKNLIKTDSGEQNIKSCLPPLTFDGI